jgi:hypothetical protein
MAKYRKKPVVIEAVQAIAGSISLCPGVYRDCDRQAWCIKTLEGVMTVSEGDWIVTGVKGEFYPIKDEIFRMTYEPVSDRES